MLGACVQEEPVAEASRGLLHVDAVRGRQVSASQRERGALRRGRGAAVDPRLGRERVLAVSHRVRSVAASASLSRVRSDILSRVLVQASAHTQVRHREGGARVRRLLRQVDGCRRRRNFGASFSCHSTTCGRRRIFFGFSS